MPALRRQLRFHRFALGFGFRRFELGEEAVDPRLRVLQQLARRVTVGAVMSSVASCRERTSSIAESAASASLELGAGDQQFEASAGDAGFPLASGGAHDDAVVGVDRFEDRGRVVGDVGGGGPEDELGVPFDGAVAGVERGVESLDRAGDVAGAFGCSGGRGGVGLPLRSDFFRLAFEVQRRCGLSLRGGIDLVG